MRVADLRVADLRVADLRVADLSVAGEWQSGELASFCEKAASGAFSTEPITSYRRQKLEII